MRLLEIRYVSGDICSHIFYNISMRTDQTFQYSFKSSLPVMAGYLVLGIGFGMLMSSHGYAWWWSTLMSAIIYAGSMQYVCVGLLSGGASLISTAIMTLMVNARHLFYAITMVEPYRDAGRAKPYLIFSLTDETFALVQSPALPEGIDRRRYHLYVSLLDHSYWIAGSTIGAVLGNAFDLPTRGIDFSMTALFVVIVVDQWEKTKDHLPAMLGILISVLCLLLFGPDRFLIPTILAITAALLLLRKRLSTGKETIS